MKTKTKLTVAIASVLSVATLAGTGYAGWVLSHNESQNKTGSMEAYGVTDKTVTLDIQDFDDPKAIVWGKTTKASGLNGTWFGFTDDVKEEAFNPALNFTVTNKETDDHATPVIESATITVTDVDNAYKNCLDNHLITGATSTNESGKFVADIKQGIALVEHTESSNVFTYKLNLQEVQKENLFGWGTAFEGKNPVNYYNQHSAEETINNTETTWFADAKNKMERIEKLDKISFRIDLTVNHASL